MTTIEMCRLNSRAILFENNIMENARRWYGADFMVLWSRRDAKSLRTTQNAIFFFHSDSGCEATSFMSFVRLRQSICFMQISLALPSSSISCRAPRRNRTEKIPRFIEFCLRFAVVFIELFNSDYLCLVPRPCLPSPLCSAKNCNLHLIIPHLTHLTFGDTFFSSLLRLTLEWSVFHSFRKHPTYQVANANETISKALWFVDAVIERIITSE